MSTDDRPRDELVKEAIDEVRLGDALANDEDLASTLSSLQEAIQSDASGAGGWWTVEFLKNAWADYASPVWRSARKAFGQALKRFTDVETRRILARSEAKINQAKAQRIEAEADAIRAVEERRNKLLEFLIRQNIDMAAEQRNDLLRIVFVKPEGIENPDD